MRLQPAASPMDRQGAGAATWARPAWKSRLGFRRRCPRLPPSRRARAPAGLPKSAPMAPGAVSSLVEHLAEAEQLLTAAAAAALTRGRPTRRETLWSRRGTPWSRRRQRWTCWSARAPIARAASTRGRKSAATRAGSTRQGPRARPTRPRRRRRRTSCSRSDRAPGRCRYGSGWRIAKRDNMLSSAEIQRMEADNMQSSAEIQRMEAAMESMTREGKSSEIAEMQQELIEARISAAKNMLIQKNQLGREKKELGRENQTLKRQLEASELQGAKAKSEEEIMRVNIVSMQKTSTVWRIANLKARPDSSSSEDDK
ncbi:unnamed protein product, partial [Prorocentrum cordatum]